MHMSRYLGLQIFVWLFYYKTNWLLYTCFLKQTHGIRVKAASEQPVHSKFKTSMCRDFNQRGSCPRGQNCTFAHSEDELDK